MLGVCNKLSAKAEENVKKYVCLKALSRHRIKENI